jgi:hypothetical protein
MRKLKLVKNERRTYDSKTESVVGYFKQGGDSVVYEYSEREEHGSVITGSNLLLGLLGASNSFKALTGKVSNWDQMDEGLADVFEDFETDVRYWRDGGDSGYNATLKVHNAVETAKAVLQAFVLGIFSGVTSDDYVGDFWGYDASNMQALVDSLESNPEFMQAADAVGCPLKDVTQIIESSLNDSVAENLGAEYDKLNDSEVSG